MQILLDFRVKPAIIPKFIIGVWEWSLFIINSNFRNCTNNTITTTFPVFIRHWKKIQTPFLGSSGLFHRDWSKNPYFVLLGVAIEAIPQIVSLKFLRPFKRYHDIFNQSYLWHCATVRYHHATFPQILSFLAKCLTQDVCVSLNLKRLLTPKYVRILNKLNLILVMKL